VFAHFTVTYLQEKEVPSLAATCDTMYAWLGYCLKTRLSPSLSMQMCLIFLTVLLCQPFCLRRVTRRFRLSLEDKGLLMCISRDYSLFMTFISHKLLRCSLLSLTRYLSLSLPRRGHDFLRSWNGCHLSAFRCSLSSIHIVLRFYSHFSSPQASQLIQYLVACRVSGLTPERTS